MENMSRGDDSARTGYPREKSKKFAEFHADAMTLNVSTTRIKTAICVAIFLSSNMVYSKCPGNVRGGPFPLGQQPK
jgi:hypothetical protein